MSEFILKEFIDIEVKRLIKESYQLSAKDMDFLRRYPIDYLLNQKNDFSLKLDLDLFDFLYSKGLRKFGEGASRSVYGLSTSKVLKVAMNRFGLQQNKREVEVYTNPLLKPVVTRIYDYHPQYLWIIAEAVKTFENNTSAFEEKIGISPVTLQKLIRSILSGDNPEKTEDFPEELKDYKQVIICYKHDIKDKEFVQNMINLVLSGFVSYNEIRIEQFGINVNGNVVMLDTGL